MEDPCGRLVADLSTLVDEVANPTPTYVPWPLQAQDEARKMGVEIEYYSVIYDVIDKIDALLKQILSPTPDGELVGSALVKQVRTAVREGLGGEVTPVCSMLMPSQ